MPIDENKIATDAQKRGTHPEKLSDRQRAVRHPVPKGCSSVLKCQGFGYVRVSLER